MGHGAWAWMVEGVTIMSSLSLLLFFGQCWLHATKDRRRLDGTYGQGNDPSGYGHNEDARIALSQSLCNTLATLLTCSGLYMVPLDNS